MQILTATIKRLESLAPLRCLFSQCVGNFQQRRGFRLNACTILLALVCLPIESHAQQAEPVRTLYLATSNLPPVVNADSTGYLDRILIALAQRTGMAFELHKMPAARGLMQADTGALDGDVARTDINEDQHPHLIRVPEAIIDAVVAGLYRRHDINVETLDDFSQYRIGYVRGWKLVESLFQDNSQATVTRTVGQLLEMLYADRIDIAVMAVASGRLMASERGMQNLRVTDYSVRRHAFLYLHERHADLIPVIDSAIQSLKRDGSYKAIINAYNAENQ